MSRIPRSHFSTTLKSSTTMTASTPLDVAKKSNAHIKVEPNQLKFSDSAEFSIIEKTAEPKSLSTVPLKPIQNVPLKRSATTLHHPPKKQMKVAPNRTVNTTKIAPIDYKAKYNDLLDQYELLKTENSSNISLCREHLEELQTLQCSLTNLSKNNADLNERLSVVDSENDKYKKDIENLEIKVKEIMKDCLKQSKENDNLTLQLSEAGKQLSVKLNEYEVLKSVLDTEYKKSFTLKMENEEKQKEIVNISSEITCLKMKLNLYEEKNNENLALIFNLKTENEKLKDKINNVDSKNINLFNDLESKKVDYDKMSNMYDSEVDKCNKLREDLSVCQTNVAKYINEIVDEKKCNELLRMKNEEHAKHIEMLSKQNEEMQRKLESMYENEKNLRNNIQDLKGHIRVFCRIRPPLSNENSKSLLSVNLIDSSSMELEKTSVNLANNGLSKKQNFKHSFAFDGIFSMSSNQSEVFEEVSTLIQSALDGYNVCIFAYGQTGSGKTYTMEGHNDKLGIIPRAIDMIFNKIPELNKLGWDYTVTASFLEIYNETIYDLLDPSKDQEDHSIKMADAKGSEIYVSNLKEEIVCNSKELASLLHLSQKNRKTAATISNERSSRSHSITKIKFNAVCNTRKEKFTSYLNLVDLAGSESGKTTQRMDETKSINKSLSVLSNVILALQSKQNHVPYRNSKLTHLLMPSLGGNSKTLMLVNISQLDDCYQETLNSLRFATTVNSCKNGVTKKNISNL